MKDNFVLEDEPQFRYYTRTSRTEDSPISQIKSLENSITHFSNKELNNNFDNKELYSNQTPKKGKKKVKFKPLISVVNIESYKKYNYVDFFGRDREENEKFFSNENKQKCILCLIV